MAEIRVGGRVDEPQSAVPWERPLTLGWTRLEDRPRRLRLGGVLIDAVDGPMRLPWLPCRLQWEDSAGLHETTIRVAEGARPDDARVDVLRGFSRTLKRFGPIRLENITQVPLFSVAALWQWLEPAPFDALLKQTIHNVVDACSRPRSWLREERVVQAVGRVKRPARDAIRHLSRHPEHAGSDGIRVYPERILASVQEEDLDLYENRVLITMVHRLLDRALHRLARLQLALAKLEELRQDIDRTHKFAQYRRWGLLKKMVEGKDGELGAVLERGDTWRLELQRQIQSLNACLDTPLGRELRFSPAASVLRETNILTWDLRYQVLPLLWRALDAEDRQQGEPIDPMLDDLDRTWADFCLLTLLRALADVGFTGTGPVVRSNSAGSRLLLRQPNPKGAWLATVDIEENTFMLQLSRDVLPSVSPVVARTGPRPQPSVVSPRPVKSFRFVPTFCGTGPRPGVATPEDVWLHPHPLAELDADDVGAARHRAQVHGNALSIAVAPWSFGSVDRLARLIQLWTLGHELSSGELRDRCPSCQGPSRATRDGAECQNDECGTSWGFRRCECGKNIPKLLPKPPNPTALEELVFDHSEPARRILLAEMLGGRDLLADWCLDDTGVGQRWMVCPWCGRCGNTSCTSPLCKSERR